MGKRPPSERSCNMTKLDLIASYLQDPIDRRGMLKRMAAVGLSVTGISNYPRNVTSAVAQPMPSVPAFLAGFNVFIYSTPDQIKDRIAALLDRLVAMNVNSVALAIWVFQDGLDASNVYKHNDNTVSDNTIRLFADAAHKRGLTVMLRPLLDETTFIPGGGWRGVIQPADRNAWFSSYGAIIRDWARLAQETGIEMFAIGAELVSLENEWTQWVNIIDRTREAYEGQVLYSFNAAAAAEILTEDSLRFVSELDFIGIDAYYPLDAPDGASSGQLITAWQPSIKQIQNIRRSSGKKTVLTEVGVRSVAGSFRQPALWAELSTVSEDVSQEDQSSYFSALSGIMSFASVNEEGVRLRDTASVNAAILAELARGVEVRVTGPAETEGGIVWWPVEDVDTGTVGYVAEDFLDPKRPFDGLYIWGSHYDDLKADATRDRSYSVFDKLAEPVIAESFNNAHIRK